MDELVVVTQSAKIPAIARLARERGVSKLKCVVEGGADRTQSAYLGVHECSERAELIAIHDGARPLVESLEKLSLEDIALLEIIKGKISYELYSFPKREG